MLRTDVYGFTRSATSRLRSFVGGRQVMVIRGVRIQFEREVVAIPCEYRHDLEDMKLPLCLAMKADAAIGRGDQTLVFFADGVAVHVESLGISDPMNLDYRIEAAE